MTAKSKKQSRGLEFSVMLFISLIALYYFLHSAVFNVKDVKITGVTAGKKSQVLALSGLRVGVNIFEVDTRTSSHTVMTAPYVKTCRVLRRLPSTVEVRVVERKPWAVVPNKGKYLVVDDEGVVLQVVDTWPTDDLVVVTLEEPPGDVRPGQQVGGRGINMLSGILRKLPSSSFAISEYHYDRDRDEITIYAYNGTAIRFGNNARLEDKLALWPEVSRVVNDAEHPADYIDLRYKGHPVIKYKGTS